MGITDELRKWAARELAGWKMARERLDALTAIADRIDAEHEEVVQREHETAYDAGYQNGENAILAVLDKRGNSDVDKTMGEHGWYRALDADKKPIRLGDEVYQVKGGWVCAVESISFYPDNTTVSFGCKHSSGCDSAHNVRHYYEPTVEDVLREFAMAVCKDDALTIRKDVVDEYAAKLRLADREEQ